MRTHILVWWHCHSVTPCKMWYKLKSASLVKQTIHTLSCKGAFHLTQPYRHARKRKYDRSLTVMFRTTTDEFNVLPKTQRMIVTSFPWSHDSFETRYVARRLASDKVGNHWKNFISVTHCKVNETKRKRDEHGVTVEWHNICRPDDCQIVILKMNAHWGNTRLRKLLVINSFIRLYSVRGKYIFYLFFFLYFLFPFIHFVQAHKEQSYNTIK